jgi:hypothetical protein
MTAASNINPQDLAAALGHVRKALDALDTVHDEWIVREKTRPAAAVLKPVNDHLRRLITMLDDPTADHYIVAHDLGVVIAQLMVTHETAFLQTLIDLEKARQKIMLTIN